MNRMVIKCLDIVRGKSSLPDSLLFFKYSFNDKDNGEI